MTDDGFEKWWNTMKGAISVMDLARNPGGLEAESKRLQIVARAAYEAGAYNELGRMATGCGYSDEDKSE